MAEVLDDVDWQGKVFSGGWVSAHGGVVDSVEPATGEVLARAGLADAGDIAAAAAAAKAAQPGWAAQPGPERAAVLRRASRVLEENRAEFERWLVREGGAVPGKAAFEVDLVLGELWEAAALPTQPWGLLLPASEAGRQSVARDSFPATATGKIRRVELRVTAAAVLVPPAVTQPDRGQPDGAPAPAV
jgi:benzaldehyde dehydrogenase (NAD)